MRNLLYSMLIGSLLLAMTACGDDDGGSSSSGGSGSDSGDAQKSKTVLIYMPWTGNENGAANSLYSFFNKNISDIEQAITEQKGLGSTRLLVYIASSYSNAVLVDISYQKNQCVRDTLKTYTNQDVTTESGIRTILEDAYSVSPTPTYAMIIGAHATGWLPRGSAPWNAGSVTEGSGNSGKAARAAARQPRHAFGGGSVATQTDVTTLADAIAHSSLKQLQFLCFDDCYMSNVETAYALRHCTTTLVASTSEIMDVGIPYKQVWQHLAATPDYASACNAFLSFYSSYTYPYGTLSAIDCTKIEQLVPLMRSFNASFEATDEAISDVQPLDGFNSTVFYDFMDYVSHVSTDATLTASIQSALHDIVLSTVSTPLLFSQFLSSSNKYATGSHSYTVNTNSGITISDPSVNANAFDSKKETEWWKATH